MGEVSNGVLLAASAISAQIKETDGTEERFKLAAKLVRTEFTWMFHGGPKQLEEESFKAAVGALILVSDDETKERIQHEMRLLGALSAMASGIPVDFPSMLDESIKPIGLVGMWKDTATA